MPMQIKSRVRVPQLKKPQQLGNLLPRRGVASSSSQTEKVVKFIKAALRSEKPVPQVTSEVEISHPSFVVKNPIAAWEKLAKNYPGNVEWSPQHWKKKTWAGDPGEVAGTLNGHRVYLLSAERAAQRKADALNINLTDGHSRKPRSLWP